MNTKVDTNSTDTATGKFANGYNDCKHYSLFQAGVFDALNRMGKKIDWCYRFANYKIFSTTPHHVFVVVKINGIEYWCDPVLETWNNKKAYINKIDKKMSLYSISGIGCNCSYSPGNYGMSEIGRVPKAQRKAKQAQRRSARRGGEGCTGRTVAKYAPPLIAGRKAFLLLVRLNFKKFAVKLHNKLNSNQRAALLSKWCGLGGTAKQLELTVNKAYSKYIRKNPTTKIGDAGIGVAVETIIATATPILAVLAKFLGGEKGEDISDAITESGTAFTEGQQSEGETTSGVGALNPYLIYGALGLGAIYLLMSKKRR